MLNWGEYLPRLERLKQAGQRVAALDTKPTLYDDCQFVFGLFSRLNAARQVGGFGGACPIDVGSIVSILDLYRIESLDERQEIFDLLQQMDRSYLMQAKTKTQAQTPDKPNADT